MGFFSCTTEDYHDRHIVAKNFSAIKVLPKEILSFKNPDNIDGRILANFIFDDSLFFALSYKPRLDLQIFDFKDFTLLKSVPLDPNFFAKPSGIFVHNLDSIFISDEETPHIFLINSQGEILNDYNLYTENMGPTAAVGFPSFNLFFGYSNPFVYHSQSKNFWIPLRQLDLWWFEEKKSEFNVLGSYSVLDKRFTGTYGKFPGYYGDPDPWYLPFYLSHQSILLKDSSVYLTYPLDNGIYHFNLSGELLNIFPGAFKDLLPGVPDKMEDSYEELRELSNSFTERNSFFGDFVFNEKTKHFYRVYQQCLPNIEGICLSKKLYVLKFGENLEPLDIYEVEGSGYSVDVLPFRNGLLLKYSESKDDDLFPFNLYLEL